MFSRIRAPGLWTFDSVVTSAEFEAFDANIANAIDGKNGGSYSLSSDLEIGSVPTATVRFASGFFQITSGIASIGISGGTNELYINSFTVVYGKAFFESDVTIDTNGSNAFVVKANTTFQNSIVQIGNDDSAALTIYSFTQFYGAEVHNAAVTFNANVTIGNANTDVLSVNANAQFHAACTFSGGITCTAGTATLGGNGTVLQGPLTMGSGGSIVQNVAAGDDSATTFSPIDFHEVVMEAGVLTSNTDWHVDDAGCQDGHEITFGNKDATHAITVRKLGGVPVTKPNGSPLNLLNAWARCVRIGGVWTLTQYGSYPTT